MPDSPLSPIASLDALFARAERPVYAVDRERVVVFANSATAVWLDLSADAVVGRRVAYQSTDDTAAGSLLTGLCPPPEASAGSEVVGTISCVAKTGGVRTRRARHVPLGDGAVLVISEPSDLTTDELANLVRGSSPDALHQAIHQFRAERSRAAATTALLGRSPATLRLRRQFDAAVASGCSTLIVGASPQDRRELAESLHHATNNRPTTARSTRHDPSNTLLWIDTPLLFVEEINERITAALEHSPAVTIALLEVDESPEDKQRAIARMLADAPAVRLLATANDPAAVADELHTRIATITLTVPTLADRRDDLPLLIQSHVEQLNAESDTQVGGLTDSALELLAAYPFRDLEQLGTMIASAHGKCRGPLIDRGDLPSAAEQAALAAELEPAAEAVDLDQLLADVEREVVTRALAVARGNKAEAARLTGLTRPRFYRLLERLGLIDTADGGDA